MWGAGATSRATTINLQHILERVSESSDPPEPPFERAGERSDDSETVRQRVRKVVAGLSEPTPVSGVAEAANCSVPGARSTLREYAEMGLVVRADDSPEAYERNAAYFEFLRGHRLAQEHDTETIRRRLAEAYRDHLRFVERFGVDSPDEVTVDEREAPERARELFEWESLLAETDDYRAAYRQLEGRMPVTVEQLPTPEAVEANNGVPDTAAVDPVYFDAATVEEFPRLAVVAEPYCGGVQDELSETTGDTGEGRRANAGE